ncbi:4Fe-4S single cluster domain-containing protein [Fimbriiglobus ruber]|uniref:Ribonucleotide reductase of class III (Anaerobic), activating protein n=1 Tax=Fimbriiglobus ruber TaxID=1908690 RepID=A0A225DAT7_9BACT|nr:4Fe-4S single cluster domain-containing protein [Fimbriiglobus ruber]OWK38083.1 Ribonucleotide reductase of class III (anaerobic), activating protein [Fimbriiglobus ruber]
MVALAFIMIPWAALVTVRTVSRAKGDVLSVFHPTTDQLKETNAPADLIMRVAQIVPRTEAEGPGVRFAVWFQGCPLRCPGCCNPEFLPFAGGEAKTLGEVLDWLDRTRAAGAIEGVSLLGGEPFAHAAAGAALARAARDRGLTVMVYSGFTVEQIRANPDPAVAALLALTDLLVDGPYERERPDTERRWVGSTNQRVHFLTEKYHPDDPCWRARNTLEIRVDRTQVSVNGFPAPDAIGLWKPKWARKSGPREQK